MMRAGWLAAAALALGACGSPGELGYNPKADPLADLAAAKSRAHSEKKLVLVSAGGDWCGPCRRLHAFMEDDEPTARLVADHFIRVQVYLGEETGNDEFFEKAGLETTDYVPHFWVLRADGTLVSEQDPSELELDESDDYDPRRFADFVQRMRSAT